MGQRATIGGAERSRAKSAPRAELGDECWPSGKGSTRDVHRPDRLLRLAEVSDITGLSRPTIYRAISDGRFPRPVKFGSASRWSAQEIADHVERLKASRPVRGSRP